MGRASPFSREAGAPGPKRPRHLWPGLRAAATPPPRLSAPSRPRRFLFDFYHYFYMLSNALFYVSSAINPVLYNLVSASFRQAFLATLACLCPLWGRRRKRPALSRKTNSVSSNHTFSSNVTRETLY